MESGQRQPAGPATGFVQEGAQRYCGSFQLADWFKGLHTAAGSWAESLRPWYATVGPGWVSTGKWLCGHLMQHEMQHGGASSPVQSGQVCSLSGNKLWLKSKSS